MKYTFHCFIETHESQQMCIHFTLFTLLKAALAV